MKLNRYLCLVLCFAWGANSYAASSGQSVSVQYGTVISASPVDLKSGAVPAGALIGGTLGYASAKGKSSSKKNRNAIIGGLAGSAIARRSRGDTRGTLYGVDLGSNGGIQVASNQSEIKIGDCVAIERSGDSTNIRRMSAGYCEPKYQIAREATHDEAIEEASECIQAKQALLASTTVQAAELAAMKVSLLCND